MKNSNDPVKSIWRKPWKGPRAVFLFCLVVVAPATFFAVMAMGLLSEKRSIDLANIVLISAVSVAVAGFLAIQFIRWLCSWCNLKRFLFGGACFITLIALLYAEENWRGKRAWENFKSAWEAKGEKFDVASFIPKLVPAEQNFAMTPFLAPLLDYRYIGQPGRVVWRDSNAVARAQEIKPLPMFPGKNFPYNIDNWAMGAFTDLAELQTLYRANTNFPSTPRPQGPALDVLFALSKYDSVFNELRHASSRP